MTARPSHPTSVRAVERLYRLCLHCYPRSFRRRYADQMVLTFRDAQQVNVGWRALRFWAREAVGLGRALPREWGRAGSGALRSIRLDTGGPFGTAFVFVVVLALYVFTLAPTVTFWDAGEFLAASKTLGIPHPPGSPLFTLLSNVWARIVPFGEYAFRLNLLTAVFGAAAAAAVFVIVREAVRNRPDTNDYLATATGAASALVAASAFTVWQNANETEVYMIAAFTVTIIGALAIRWRRHRGTPHAHRILLLQLYLGALSIGNHLLALLIGPAVIAFMAYTMRAHPLSTSDDRRREWSRLTLFATAWGLLIAIGLGNTLLLRLTAVAGAAAVILCVQMGERRFPLAAAAVAAVGVSTYVFLYIRAGLQPFLNEGDPATWESLLAVIRREQYPPRLPTDNPLFDSGPSNPGRTLQLLWWQTLNYLQYFDWQWSAGLRTDHPAFAAIRLPFTIIFTALGIAGARLLYRRDRGIFWLLTTLFAITGPGLVLYMNFKPGFSIGHHVFPGVANHEVRERDYFFLISFQVWGALAGLGLLAAYRTLQTLVRRAMSAAPRGRTLRIAPAIFVMAIVPTVLNLNAADRARGPATELARDWAYDLLQTVEPYGVLFTGGDNDTFPLWALQAEGFRPDVTVVVLPLSNLDWFIRQLRDKPVAPFDPDDAPWYASAAPESPPPPLHSWSDEEIAALRPMALPADFRFRTGAIDTVFPRGTGLRIQDILTLRLIQENAGRRPFYLALSAGANDLWQRLGDSLVQEGLAFRLYADQSPDASQLAPGVLGPPVHVERTDTLAWEVYRYAGLFNVDTLEVDSTSRTATRGLSLPYLALAQAYLLRGDADRYRRNLERARHLDPTLPILARPAPPFADSPATTELNP